MSELDGKEKFDALSTKLSQQQQHFTKYNEVNEKANECSQLLQRKYKTC